MIEIEQATTKDGEKTKVQKHTPDNDYQLEPPKLYAWLASLVTISLILTAQFLARGDDPYLRGTGVFVLLLAGIFIFAPFCLLTKHGGIKDGQTYTQARIVVDRCLYAITRHPQYLGYIFLACGFALLSQHWVAVEDDNKLKPPGCSMEGPPGYDSVDWNAGWIEKTPYYKILFDGQIVGGIISSSWQKSATSWAGYTLIPTFRTGE